MKIAKPNAIMVLSSMIAGSLIGRAAYLIMGGDIPPIICEIFATLTVGLLLIIAAVLEKRLLISALFLACFLVTMIASWTMTLAENGLQLPISLTSLFSALLICDQIMKRLNKH
jgi:hypothetical protein